MFNFTWPELSMPAIIAWGALAVIFLWSVWHDLIKLFGYSPYSIEKVGGPDDIHPEKNGPEFYEKHRELIKLGFQPLGVIQAKLGAAFSVDETVYGKGPAGIMAEIGSVSKAVYFVSTTTQGGSMSTGDVAGIDSIERPNYRQKYDADKTVAELLAIHQSDIPAVFGTSFDLLPSTTVEEAMEVQRGFDTHSHSRRMTRGFARSLVTQMLLWVGIPTIGLAFFTGMNSVWPGIIGAVIALLLGSCMRMLSQHSFNTEELATDGEQA